MSGSEHPDGCNCGAHDEALDPSRRAFVQRMGLMGALLAGAGPIIGCSQGSDEKPITSGSAVRSGKAGKITILHTSDIHAQLHTHDEFFYDGGKAVYRKRGGFAVLKTMIDALRAEDPANTIVIDGGDCFQGSGTAAMSEGRAIIPLVDRIGYDLMLPGNWEVVFGKEAMMHDLGAYKADKLCANMFHTPWPDGITAPSGEPMTMGELIFPPYWTKVVAGIKLGFIGYNDPLTPKRQSPAYSYGIRFARPEENVAKYIRYLRDYEQCAMVFLITHMGLAQQVDLANKPQVDGADFILGADTHERVRVPIQAKYAKVTEPGAFGSFVSRLEIVLENGVVKDTHYELLDVDPEKYAPDEDMLSLIAQQRAPFATELDKVVGSTKRTLVRYYVLENPMDNFITDALMWKLKPDVAISNGFRFCTPIVASEEHHAEITNDHLWSMVPVDSNAKYGVATGHQILNWLERELNNVFAKEPADRLGGWVVRFKGLELEFTAGKDMGGRVNSVKIGGEPLVKDKLYRIAACEREGDPNNTLCRMEDVTEPHLAGITMHTILREYLKEFSPVAPEVEGRVKATDVPHDLLSQLEGYDYQFR